MQIKHLQNTAIDYSRWNQCISQSNNQLAYAYTWYLDVVSPDWEALVSEEYEFIMPLPVKRRYDISYLVQPILTQQLGIFSRNAINEIIVQKFIQNIPYFSYELNLNEQNFHPKALILPNFILNLKQPYNQIASKYSKNTQRNIDKSRKLDLKVQSEFPLDAFLDFYYSVEKNYSSPKLPVIKNLIEKGIVEKAMTLYGVFSTDNNLIAALCLLHSENRLTYLLPVSSLEGKRSSAMFFLIDKLIRENVGNVETLDFEGSRIEGIARFYKGFGAKNQPYYILKRFRPSFLIGKFSEK